jgi:hypothetical protein
MRNLLLFCALAFSLVPLSSPATEAVRPVAEMKGDCAAYKIPLTQEFKDWELGPTSLATDEGKKGTILPLGKRLKLMLEPAGKVKFAKPPEKGGRAGYGAIVPLRVANTGEYRISLGERAWVDVVEKEGNRLEAASFEMQTGCDKIRKVVTYKLNGGRDYLLQVAGARGDSAELMISKSL